jgi:hypothetical protein
MRVIVITANCDSLLLLLENTRKEVHHFQRENTALMLGIDVAEQNFADHVAVDFSRRQQSADIESRVIALEVKITNKTPSQEDTVDITQTTKSPGTFTVNNSLGGVLKYKIYLYKITNPVI